MPRHISDPSVSFARGFGAHTGGQQLFARRPEDAGKVLHEIPGGLEHPEHLLVGSRDELEPPDRRQALHVVAVDLRPGDLVPRLLPGGTQCGNAAVRYQSLSYPISF